MFFYLVNILITNGIYGIRRHVRFTENKTDRLHLEPVHESLEIYMFETHFSHAHSIPGCHF